MSKNVKYCNIKYELDNYFQNIFQDIEFLIHKYQGVVLGLFLIPIHKKVKY